MAKSLPTGQGLSHAKRQRPHWTHGPSAEQPPARTGFGQAPLRVAEYRSPALSDALRGIGTWGAPGWRRLQGQPEQGGLDLP